MNCVTRINVLCHCVQVVVPKAKGEILGVVIVESGWGSMLPTIVIANLCPTGPAARCGHLNIGDQVNIGAAVKHWAAVTVVATVLISTTESIK